MIHEVLTFAIRCPINATMATNFDTIEELSRATGLKPSTLIRVTAALRTATLGDDPMVPSGGRGGGKAAAHFNAWHLKNVCLALAGAKPSDGPDAVRVLDGLRRPGDPLTFGQFISGVIAETDDADFVSHEEEKWELALCLNPPIAWQSRMVGKEPQQKEQRLDVWSTNMDMPIYGEKGIGRIRRHTVITVVVLRALRALYINSTCHAIAAQWRRSAA
jgi:hypothetical protein